MKYNERGKSRIEVSDILNYFKDINSYYNDCTRYDTLKRMLEDIVAETEEDAERKTGKWRMGLTKDSIGFNTLCYRCSECNGIEYSTPPFCRMCGAKMEGD